jgi:hypothetical protein
VVQGVQGHVQRLCTPPVPRCKDIQRLGHNNRHVVRYIGNGIAVAAEQVTGNTVQDVERHAFLIVIKNGNFVTVSNKRDTMPENDKLDTILDKLEKIESRISDIETDMKDVKQELKVVNHRLSLIENRLGNIEPWVSVDNNHLKYNKEVA